ncbi:SDR family NAD(P)-dependent oxidoreductase [Nostoc sp. C117]|uniref:type I polyketide synthase n=1 Tax=Nostoc sp. C117 TaxID=3349875 RepID=UPI00370DC3DC
MNEQPLPNLDNDSEIAIIGISCRLPQAKNIDEFWHNLREGVECISFFNSQELVSSGVDPELLNNTNYVRANSVLSDIDMFDAFFFDISAREAETIDPQHRLFLEQAWEAIENAGYDPQTYKGSIGVYAGSGINTYLLNNLYKKFDTSKPIDDYKYRLLIGNDKDFLSTRVSYQLNLKGPSINVQTACSTSLVAVHLASQSLLNGECDIALAGGVAVRVPQKTGYLYQEGMIFSPDGHCRAFDAKAAGTIGGSGVGLVVLKRLEDAIADGDFIHAIIKGSAINNDGALKVGYTAPSVDGQSAVILEAQTVAGIAPETITYMEAHGTGTPLGDPIEITALTQAFSTNTQNKGFCAIGSVKTNLGHLDVAAGVAGLIKTVLALKHQQIPPSLHFESPNPKIDFANSPFYVNTELLEWETKSTPRRAGVSSFGIGGTNAHVVLEEAPPQQPSGKCRPYQLLVISAKTSSALEVAIANLSAHLQQHPELNLADVAYTLSKGRKAFDYRRMLVCQDIAQTQRLLSEVEASEFHESGDRSIIFMFSGQGSQYVNMGRELYQLEPTFQEQVDKCAEILQPHLGLDLRHILYPNSEQTELATQQLQQTALAQPALFVIEYSLAQLWLEWGIRPVAMIGHSIGEYVAATIARVFSLEDALAVVATRGKLMQQMPTGSMLAVPLTEQQVQPLLGQQFSLAAVNNLSSCVISGPTSAIEALQQQLAIQGIDTQPLFTSHAFHSAMMEPVVQKFTQRLQQVNLQPPQIPYISNLTGTWITADEATNPDYWAQHLRQTVRFAEGLEKLLQEPAQILLEVGPGWTLSKLTKQHPNKDPEQVVLTSLRHPRAPQSDLELLLNTLGHLWLNGAQVDWAGFYAHEQRYRLPLPTYPFERQRYWIEPENPSSLPIEQKTPALLDKKLDVADWFYIPSWKSSVIPKASHLEISQSGCWLVFADECGIGSELLKRLPVAKEDVVIVRLGEKFSCNSRPGQHLYTINPQNLNDYEALLNELWILNKIPHKILHLWSITKNDRAPSEIEFFEKTQNLGFYSLLFLAQALGKQHLDDSVEICVLSSNMQLVTGEELLCPEKATVLGLCLVISQEYPHITCQSIDITMPVSHGWQEEKLINSILSELVTKSADPIVAYRGHRRWLQTFEPVRLEAPVQDRPELRKQGVYLITGGLGNIGLVLAEYLAKTVQARLILIGRSPFPARVAWQQWLDSHDTQDKISQQICKILALEAHGAKVIVQSADVANLEQMQSAIASACEIFGEINGVIHAAGLVENKYFKDIQQIEKAECEQQFHAKIHGLFVLQKILQGKALDFALLTSSLSSVLGGLGFAAYSAANMFMDAFAHKCIQANLLPWFSLNWDGWRIPAEKENARFRATLAEGAIAPDEGIEVFKRILSNTYPQVVVSTTDLKARINQWVKPEPFKNTESANKVATTSPHSRPNLKNEYIAPKNEIEQAIAEVWQELLGINEVGRYDNFFELGGDSLLIVQVRSKLQKRLNINFSINDAFEHSTISALGQYLSKDQIKESVSQPINERAHKLQKALAQDAQMIEKRRKARE